MSKNARLPEISIFLQFGDEILALLCSDNSIRTFLILPVFLTLGTEAKLERFVFRRGFNLTTLYLNSLKTHLCPKSLKNLFLIV